MTFHNTTDLPTDADHYVHRAGRCGRAGRPGIVINMTHPEIKFVISKFKDKLGLQFDEVDVKDSKLWTITRTKLGLDGLPIVESEQPLKKKRKRTHYKPPVE
eukprot:12590-Heterococcus_DN1.PRE.1